MAETLTERDLRALMDVIEEGRRDDPTEGLPWATMYGITRLIPCDRLNFPHLDLTHNKPLIGQSLKGHTRTIQTSDDFKPNAQWWQDFKEYLPHRYALRTSHPVEVLRTSDLYTLDELRRAPFYMANHDPKQPLVYGLHTFLPSLPGRLRKISIHRGRRDFTERDRLVLQLLRPHLYEVYIDSQRRRQVVPHLTRREWGVLQLVHAGLSNNAIANELTISIATVRKHMEHIFDRTGTRTRSAAAALMIPHLPETHQ